MVSLIMQLCAKTVINVHFSQRRLGEQLNETVHMQQALQKLSWQNYNDVLVGLPNRAALAAASNRCRSCLGPTWGRNENCESVVQSPAAGPAEVMNLVAHVSLSLKRS